MGIEILTPEEYAQRFKDDVKTVQRWCREGTLETLPRKRGMRRWKIVVRPEDKGEACNVLHFTQRKSKNTLLSLGNGA